MATCSILLSRVCKHDIHKFPNSLSRDRLTFIIPHCTARNYDIGKKFGSHYPDLHMRTQRLSLYANTIVKESSC
jgi:hypothetical protein